MALYTEAAVRANLRNREGRRVFYLASGDHLTPGARDFLRDNHIEILPPEAAKPQVYKTLQGAELREKPEHMTHLDAQVLVPKDHPRIRFRGCVDSLEADLLLAQREAHDEGYRAICKDLGDALEFARQALRRDVLNEPMEPMRLGGLDPQEPYPAKILQSAPFHAGSHPEPNPAHHQPGPHHHPGGGAGLLPGVPGPERSVYPGGPAPGLQPAQQLPVDSGDPAGFGAGEERVSLWRNKSAALPPRWHPGFS